MNCIQRMCSPLKHNVLVERGLDLHLRAKRAKDCLKWGSIHIILLAILLFDISNKCPYVVSNWYYLEYTAASIVGLGVVVYFLKYFLYVFRTEAVQGTKEQKNLLKFEDNDISFVTTSGTIKNKQPSSDGAGTNEVNTTILSWHSSFNDSHGLGSPNWGYSRSSPTRQSLSPQKQQQHQQQNQQHNASWNNSSIGNNTSVNVTMSTNTTFMSPYLKYARDEDIITDEQSLQKYLKEASKRDFSMNDTQEFNHNINHGSMNSFWSYCNTAANLLKTSLYQLAPSTANPNSQSKQGTTEEGGLNILNSNSEVIKKISSEKLSQYVANLRRWMSITILQRLAKEIDNIDESFKMRGIADMQIGFVGLERLKKTVENQQFVNQYVPMLPLIVPFLEMSSNQEYLVQRIKDLAKGSCIADYLWDSGSSYHGLKWDEHLPTDAAILFHIFCVYLDSQLMPLPQGGGRPFYNRYVISGTDRKSAKETIANIHNKAHCAILCTDPLKPKFNFISDKEVHACAYDRNNLFYVIIQFLIYMKTQQDASLEGVNLGRSGINILCVIEE